MISKKPLIPTGHKCTVAETLRKYHLRKTAFPFDWNVLSISTALELIQNRFADFLEIKNLVALSPIKGRYINNQNELERKRDGSIKWTTITPVICRKYNILFPHDFSENGLEDLTAVKCKYDRRINRLLKLIDNKQNLVFLYDNKGIHKEHYDLFRSADIDFKKIESNDNFIHMKNEFNIPICSHLSYLENLSSVFTIPTTKT